MMLSVFSWRGEAQKEKTPSEQDSSDTEADDPKADPREDATGQSYHHRSVCWLTYSI